MANTITEIMPKILARGLLALREQAVMPRFVNGSYSAEAAEKGDTIDVPLSSALVATEVVPAAVPPTAVDSPLTKVQITLDKWFQARFHLTDKEMVEIERNRHFMPLQTVEAVRALSNKVNADIHAEYLGVYGFTGTPATTPFATTGDAILARKILNQQRAPRTDRRGVVDFDAEAEALALAAFADAEKTGETGVKIEGEIGRKFGIDWATDDNVVTHTAGTLVANVTVTGANAIGTKTVNLTTDGTGTFNMLVGDIINIAGDSGTYVITALTGAIGISSASDVEIEPGLRIATVGSEAVTLEASHVVNLVFHRDAFAFANRPLAGSTVDTALGSQILSMTDPQTGISLRLEVSRQHKQVAWDFDILYGTKLVRPALATRIAG